MPSFSSAVHARLHEGSGEVEELEAVPLTCPEQCPDSEPCETSYHDVENSVAGEEVGSARGHSRKVVGVVGLSAVVLAGSLTFTLDGSHVIPRALAVVLVVGMWWMTEVVPLHIAAFLPAVLFPLMRVEDSKTIAAAYWNHIQFLTLGGCLMSSGLKRWNLHRRLALTFLHLFGRSLGGVVLAFMATNYILSMWMSNTAATLTVAQLIVAVMQRLQPHISSDEARRELGVILMLYTTFASTAGGCATLVGTPSNMVYAQAMHKSFPEAPEVTFAAWAKVAMPFSVILFAALCGLAVFRLSRTHLLSGVDMEALRMYFDEEYQALHPVGRDEKLLLVAYFVLLLLWVFRADIGPFPGWSPSLGYDDWVDDSTTALLVPLPLFLIPCRGAADKGTILRWSADDAAFELLLLLGGGFALARGFESTGAPWIGRSLTRMSDESPPSLLLGLVLLVVTCLTNLASNVSTIQMVLPITMSISSGFDLHPQYLALGGTLATGVCFLLPMATPPNMIALSTNLVTARDFLRHGWAANLFAVLWIYAYITGPLDWVYGISPTSPPLWADGRNHTRPSQ